jgi:two-component sensor histidine kinase
MAGAMEKKKIKVLFVDDDEDYYIIVKDMLEEIEHTAYALEWTSNADEAVTAIRGGGYDAYLFDYNLEGKTGLDLLREAVAAGCRAPIIMLTGMGDYSVDSRAMAYGATDYLNKRHLNPEVLERSIRYSIEHRKLLNDKAILLKEINHRVKNNLQMVTSLMNIGGENDEDGKTRERLNKCQSRIKALMFIHEKLSVSDQVGKMNLVDYIGSIARDLIDTYDDGSCKINLVMESDEIMISTDQAVPCGLIANEIITNSIRHAFPDREKTNRVINISINDVGGYILMSLSDNGIGLPRDFSINRTDTMGLKLVSVLGEQQLGGELVIGRGGGTEFLVKFRKIDL